MHFLLATLLFLWTPVQAHYVFPSLIGSTGTVTSPWQYVRQWAGYQSNGPVTDVTSVDIRCNVQGNSLFAPSVLSVAAGSTIGFTAAPSVYHPGPALAYMAKVPAGKTAANWDGSGAVWFKVWQEGPIFGSSLTWASDNASNLSFKIPASTPSGDYLVRIEHIGLHVAQTVGGAQFYLSCGQVTVTGGGSGKPGPLVSFPGAYKATDPGILIGIYYPIPTSYTFPGPAVWTG